MSNPGAISARATELRLFFDGACPLCSREVAALKRLDRGRGRLEFVDIAQPGFEAAGYGIEHERLMAKMHAQLSDGTWVEGMEVFRRAYAAVGLGWFLAPTGWPLLRPLFDAAYRWFARNRLRLTGRRRCEAGECGIA